jgi:hypothetical protein
MGASMKNPAKPVKKAKKPVKFKTLAKTKALVGVVTVNDISPV